MLIDCDRCEMRNIACNDCVVGAMLGADVEIGEPDRRALQTLADAGMVPPLRLELPHTGPSAHRARAGGPPHLATGSVEDRRTA